MHTKCASAQNKTPNVAWCEASGDGPMVGSCPSTTPCPTTTPSPCVVECVEGFTPGMTTIVALTATDHSADALDVPRHMSRGRASFIDFNFFPEDFFFSDVGGLATAGQAPQ
uniref:Uncharacterized protein n=1 Tax=Eutreptiella gymnastica TaxID=73025 RepID=A0A6T1ZFR0_9EUGL